MIRERLWQTTKRKIEKEKKVGWDVVKLFLYDFIRTGWGEGWTSKKRSFDTQQLGMVNNSWPWSHTDFFLPQVFQVGRFLCGSLCLFRCIRHAHKAVIGAVGRMFVLPWQPDVPWWHWQTGARASDWIKGRSWCIYSTQVKMSCSGQVYSVKPDTPLFYYVRRVRKAKKLDWHFVLGIEVIEAQFWSKQKQGLSEDSSRAFKCEREKQATDEFWREVGSFNKLCRDLWWPWSMLRPTQLIDVSILMSDTFDLVQGRCILRERAELIGQIRLCFFGVCCLSCWVVQGCGFLCVCRYHDLPYSDPISTGLWETTHTMMVVWSFCALGHSAKPDKLLWQILEKCWKADKSVRGGGNNFCSAHLCLCRTSTHLWCGCCYQCTMTYLSVHVTRSRKPLPLLGQCVHRVKFTLLIYAPIPKSTYGKTKLCQRRKGLRGWRRALHKSVLLAVGL